MGPVPSPGPPELVAGISGLGFEVVGFRVLRVQVLGLGLRF